MPGDHPTGAGATALSGDPRSATHGAGDPPGVGAGDQHGLTIPGTGDQATDTILPVHPIIMAMDLTMDIVPATRTMGEEAPQDRPVPARDGLLPHDLEETAEAPRVLWQATRTMATQAELQDPQAVRQAIVPQAAQDHSLLLQALCITPAMCGLASHNGLVPDRTEAAT